MNLITIIEIATNYPNGDIKIETVQHKITKKWASLLYMMRDGNIHKLMLSFDFSDIFQGFEKKDEAYDSMKKVVDFAINYYNEKCKQ